MSIARKFLKNMKATGFHETMENYGFSLAADYPFFYRLRGELVDCIILQPLAAGKGMRVHVSVVKMDMYPNYDVSVFPKGFTSHHLNITEKFINEEGISYYSGHWDTSGVGRFEKTFSAMSELLETEVLPWFDEIDTDKKVYESIFEDFKDDGEFDYLLG